MKKKVLRLKLIEILLQTKSSLSREQAFAYILAGSVQVDQSIIKNPKELIKITACVKLCHKKYVSRGGYKLEKALQVFGINCEGKVVLDAGCSTGGFTDCLLQKGAVKVFSVDVGYNQLDYSLRQNPKVMVMEKTNIKEVRNLSPAPHFAVADLSFRSIIPVLKHLLNQTQEKWIIILYKPQFELADDQKNTFDGVIRDKKTIQLLLDSFINQTKKMGLVISNFCESPIRGGKGNREFLVQIGEASSILSEMDLSSMQIE